MIHVEKEDQVIGLPFLSVIPYVMNFSTEIPKRRALHVDEMCRGASFLCPV